MRALIGADRDRAGDPVEKRVVGGRQGLLDQLDAGLLAGREVGHEVGGGPALIGVDDQPHAGHRRADGGEALGIALRAELELEQFVPARGGGVRHALRRAEADRVGRDHRLRRRQAGELVHADAGTLGLEVPHRAVERVARRAGRQHGLQRLAGEAGGDGALEGGQSGRHAFHALAIARIGHAFATADEGAVPQGRGDDGGLGLRATGDGEAAADGEAFRGDEELGHGQEGVGGAANRAMGSEHNAARPPAGVAAKAQWRALSGRSAIINSFRGPDGSTTRTLTAMKHIGNLAIGGFVPLKVPSGKETDLGSR